MVRPETLTKKRTFKKKESNNKRKKSQKNGQAQITTRKSLYINKKNNKYNLKNTI